MKKLFALILALVMSLSLFACGSSKTKMRFVTGGESGTYYAFGSTIAQHATNNRHRRRGSGGQRLQVQR